MWLITLRDLQWRRRRFAFGVVGTALVFAVTLLLAGLSASLRAEASRAVDGVGADAWLVKQGVTGPFSGLSALPVAAVDAVAASPGVKQADPLVVTSQTVERQGKSRPVDVTVFGYRLGGMGPPPVVGGRAPTARGEAIVNRSLGVDVGESFKLGPASFTAVGEVRRQTLRAGMPSIFVPVEDTQALVFEGQPLTSTIVTKGTPNPAPQGLIVLTADEARRDLLRPFRRALRAIDVLQVLLWLVAVAIIGTLIYLSVLERIQDFAVMKAIGTASRSLFASLAIQAIVVSVTSALVANGVAFLLAPTFPLPIKLVRSAAITLPLVAVVVGFLASLVGLRRAVSVDPALAFGSA